MGIEFTALETAALYGLLAESGSDVILKTDREGYVRHASPGIEELGFALPDMLIGPHILDLVDTAFAAEITAAMEAAMRGEPRPDWIDFSARTRCGKKRWFAMRVRSLATDAGRIYGTLCVMRGIGHVRALEDRLFAAELTDGLTGLTNRAAFIAMLDHLVETRAGGCLALLDIDRFRAINLRYGQSAGDQVLVALAELLRELTMPEDILSRIDGESYAILLPGTTLEQAEARCRHIVETIAEVGQAAGGDRLPVTASAGVAAIGATLDGTLKTVETAVMLAKAKGRNCVERAEGR
jgi:diguanylate cyclase (GGDEF)-like protein/PAS domain S-box-containing protein